MECALLSKTCWHELIDRQACLMDVVADVCLNLQELELLIYLEGVTEASADSRQPAAEQACSGSAVGPSTGSAGKAVSHVYCHKHLG